MKKKTMEFFALFVGMRKFIVMILFLIIMIVFRVSDYINGAQFADNLQLAVVAFFAANFGEHGLDLIKTYVKKGD